MDAPDRVATRGTAATFGVFVIVGVISFLADASMLWLLHGRLHLALAIATALAFGVGFLVNFSLNRTRTFHAQGPIPGQLTRYSVLVVANLIATVGLVTGLTTAGLPYLGSKAVTTALLAVINFVLYRRWVFATRTKA